MKIGHAAACGLEHVTAVALTVTAVQGRSTSRLGRGSRAYGVGDPAVAPPPGGPSKEASLGSWTPQGGRLRDRGLRWRSPPSCPGSSAGAVRRPLDQLDYGTDRASITNSQWEPPLSHHDRIVSGRLPPRTQSCPTASPFLGREHWHPLPAPGRGGCSLFRCLGLASPFDRRFGRFGQQMVVLSVWGVRGRGPGRGVVGEQEGRLTPPALHTGQDRATCAAPGTLFRQPLERDEALGVHRGPGEG
ncbi:hypothetical protein FB563_0100 [Streptomyces puniciscabiei]|uniref:Uncharacterized protein n=1 Tax=Streptomyces puniciscabiei TaxID=164348 RepID=A0A542U850_9ACTN|nr:hypothetical protein FB563_0100 [Streptomyces puniciscabiei]